MKDGISKTLNNIVADNNSSYFYNNDTKFGFDNITCTLIQIKKNKKNE